MIAINEIITISVIMGLMILYNHILIINIKKQMQSSIADSRGQVFLLMSARAGNIVWTIIWIIMILLEIFCFPTAR